MFDWMKHRADRAATRSSFQHLEPGRTYHVVRSFADDEGIVHPVGETWIFCGVTFLPHEKSLSLSVVTSAGGERQIRLRQRPETQARIAHSLFEYVLPLPRGPDRWPLLVTRQSLCLAEDVHAPHASIVDVRPDDNAAAVARTILASGYLPTGRFSGASWSLRLGPDQILFGYRRACRFIEPVSPVPLTATAREVTDVHIAYWAQQDHAIITVKLATCHTND